MRKSLASISILSILLLLTFNNSNASVSDMQIKLEKSMMTPFLNNVIKLGLILIDGECIDLKYHLAKKVLIYQVDLDIPSICLTDLVIGTLRDDFYVVKDLESRKNNFLNFIKKLL